jgi:aminoglycoside phosphotransferase (APT) family kinase protein
MGGNYEEEVARYFERLDSGIFGLTRPLRVERVSRLELGESNLNFLVLTGEGKYVFRINMDPASGLKSEGEFRILGALAPTGLVPRAYHLDTSKNHFGETLLVVGFVEGTPLSKLEKGAISVDSAARLAELVATVHSIDVRALPSDLPVRGTSVESWILRMQTDVEYVRQSRRNRLLGREYDKLVEDAIGRLHATIRGSPLSPVVGTGHGDVCAQNTIVTSESGSLRLIDWENFGLWDPAAELAMTLEAFGLDFTSNVEEDFLGTYLAIRRDAKLIQRLRLFRPLVRLEQLTWGVRHVFELLNGDMDKAFVDTTPMPKHLAFVDQMLAKCEETGLLDFGGDAAQLGIFPPEFRNRTP